MVSQIFLSLQAFFFHNFSSIQLFFHFLVLGGVRNTANYRNCEFYLVYHDSRLCNIVIYITWLYLIKINNYSSVLGTP